MTLPVLVDPSVVGLAVGDSVLVEGDEARHAFVKRLRAGEKVALTDGVGTTAVITVARASSSGLVGQVVAVRTDQPPSPSLVVVQGLPKGDRGPLAVEMLTEVGVDVIVPWAASRSVSVWRGERAEKSLARWRNTSRESAKQSRRSWFPSVAELASTSEVVDLLRGAALAVVLDEAAERPLASLEIPDCGDVVVVVGPEGGISDEELAAFAAIGATPVRMGHSVLRTSTAGVAAAAALLSRTPRWR